MKWKAFVDIASSVVVMIVALVVGGFYVQDRISERPRESAYIDSWEEDNLTGIRIGPSDAVVTVTEFMDFQCPFCAAIIPRTDSLLSKYPTEIAVVFQHFPLSIHPAAVPSAIAAECALRQDRFFPMAKAMFEGQDSLGVASWESYATVAEVPDLDAFRQCTTLPADSFPRIASGLNLGNARGVTGTPTTWINGKVASVRDAGVEEMIAELRK